MSSYKELGTGRVTGSRMGFLGRQRVPYPLKRFDRNVGESPASDEWLSFGDPSNPKVYEIKTG